MFKLPPLNAVRAFEATARHLSFTKAAAELNVTPAALSHQVKGLEDYLGIQLFLRKTRAIELTDAGKRCYPGVHSGFQQIHESIGLIQQADSDRLVVISCGPGFAAKWLAPRLYRFLEAYPDIDARVAPSLRFTDFQADGVHVSIRFGDGNYPDMHVDHMVEDFAMPLCSQRYLDEHGPIEKPEDLVGKTLIHDDALSFLADMPTWKLWFAAQGIDVREADRGMHFTHADHALDAALDGAGVVLGRRVLSARDRKFGQLIAPLDFALSTGRSFYLVCPEENLALPNVAAFRSWILDEMDHFKAIY